MDKSLFEKIVDELASEKATHTLVFALQNEPLLDNRIFELVRYLKSKRRDIYTILPTNGEYLDLFENDKISRSGLDQLTLSLNAHRKATYEQINTGIEFERVMNNILSLISDPAIKQSIEIRFALNEKNRGEISQALEYWKKQGVHTKATGITNRAGALSTYERFKLKKASRTGFLKLQFWKQLMAALRSRIGCELPFYQMNILFNGDVITCCHDWNRSVIIGNVASGSLKSVWNSERLNEIRKQITKKDYSRTETCKNCSMVNRL